MSAGLALRRPEGTIVRERKEFIKTENKTDGI